MTIRTVLYEYIQNLQDTIVAGIEAGDGQEIKRDLWERRVEDKNT
jgi:coproporphyrinogen III oxidase